MARINRKLLAIGAFLAALSPSLFHETLAQSDSSRQVAQEEQIDYYAKWLNEDVVYIITPEERTIFQHLTTPEEKERFIEQFWLRRDPDRTTKENEYKEEHYRRIAYANEHFTSGIEGWRSDRGRIYIIHGPADEVKSFTAGHHLNRDYSEGGGSTRTYPYEVWRYRHIEGLGDDVELEFVDRTFSGSFQLAVTPWDKDLLLNTPGGGLTMAEMYGARTRADHPYNNWSVLAQDEYPGLAPRSGNRPFERMERYFKSQRPEPIKYGDLKEVVNVNLSYNELPFQVREDYIRLNEAQTVVPVTLEWQNKDLTFTPVPETGSSQAKIAVYGIVTGLSNEVITEFDDDVVSSYGPDQQHLVTAGRSMYQKVLALSAGTRYKLTLVTKDLNSNRTGVKDQGLILPRFEQRGLTLSPVILSNFVRRLEGPDLEKDNLMFVIGDLWIRPSVDREFQRGQDLGIYLQAYNAALDAQTMRPDLEVTYHLEGADDVALNLDDRSGKAVDYFSAQRVVLLKILRLSELPPGKYSLVVDVLDRITGSKATARERFSIKES
jgi:GWxTD domain-containing protein